MERRDQDCYFYYYSTCLKGDECTFRHEPAALGCETICPHWQKRTCMNAHCSMRHMQLRKNRKLIPCYWENQPIGCRKPHCPFLHKYARDHHLLPILPNLPSHSNHPNLPNHPNHPNHQNHPIMEQEKKEGEPQVGTSQAAMERGEWVRGGYEQPQENVQVNSGEAPVQGNQRGGNQANGGQGTMPDPLVVSFDDGMRLY